MERLTRFWGAYWRPIVITLACLLALDLLLIVRLGSLSHGLSASEYQQQLFSASWHHLWHNPLGLPLHLLQWLTLTLIPHHGATVTRLPSVVFGAATLLAFAYIARRWYGLKTAAGGVALFACSAWVLHVSRFAADDILYLWALPAFLTVQLLWERYSERWYIQLLAIVVIALLAYIPGMIWLLIAGISLQLQPYLQGWRAISDPIRRIVLAAGLVLLLLPLAWGLIRLPSLATTWLGLPHHFDSLLNILKRLGLSLTYLFYRGPLMPTLWLDRQPVLDIFAIVAMLLGFAFYLRHLSAPRTRQLLGLLVIGAMLFALQGPVSYSLLVPLVYLVVTAGIGYLLHEWLHVFPRNPIARGIGYAVLGIVIAAACVYNLRSYFIAWPHNQLTKAAFTQSPNTGTIDSVEGD